MSPENRLFSQDHVPLQRETIPVTANEQAGAFFDRFAETFDTFYEGKRSRWMQCIDGTFRQDVFLRFSRTFEQFGDLRGKTVLDIGCGSGIYVLEALRRGAAMWWPWIRPRACWNWYGSGSKEPVSSNAARWRSVSFPACRWNRATMPS